MKAILLAAGFSTRLYPLTKEIPKGLLPLGKGTLASMVADGILGTPEISESVLITNACFAPQFRTWAAQYDSRLPVIDNGVNCLDDKLGAIGDLLFALDRTGWDDDILVATSDTLSSLDMAGFIALFRKHNAVTTAVFKTDDPSRIAGKLGCAVMKGARVTAFVEKPTQPPSLYMGVPYYIFPRASLKLIRAYKEEGNKLDAPGSIIGWFLEKGPVYAYRVNGYYYDVGTAEVYGEVKAAFASKQA